MVFYEVSLFSSFSDGIQDPFSLLFTGYQCCVPGDKAVDKRSWLLTCFLYQSKEWVEFCLYYYYAMESCTEMALCSPILTMSSAVSVAWNVATHIEYKWEFIWKESIRCQSEVYFDRQPQTYVKPEAAITVLSSWWWAVCRLKHVEQLRNIIIIMFRKD